MSADSPATCDIVGGHRPPLQFRLTLTVTWRVVLDSKNWRRWCMRIKGKETVALIGVMLIALGMWGWSTVAKRTSMLHPPEPSRGYRLVSIQEMGEICLPPEPGSGDANADTNLFSSINERDENHLLDLLRGRSVYAASQQSG